MKWYRMPGKILEWLLKFGSPVPDDGSTVKDRGKLKKKR